jgi:hypothetical protein
MNRDAAAQSLASALYLERTTVSLHSRLNVDCDNVLLQYTVLLL